MKRLSNLIGKHDAPASRLADSVEIRPCQKDEIQGGLRFILGDRGHLASDEQVVDFLGYAVHRGINVNDLWIAARGSRMLWATLPVVSPGRTMLLLAPGAIADSMQSESAGLLVGAICDHFAPHNVQLAQVLLDPPADGLHAMYRSHGFETMAELMYLQRAVRRAEEPTWPAKMTLETFTNDSRPRFASTILASYEASLDCPALNGVRDINDIVASHRATGEFDPNLWFLLEENDEPLGVLLLNRIPRTDALELVYLGLLPAARGRGIGNLMMQQALWSVIQQKHSRLSLAVDAANQPALNLYFRHGLQRVAEKTALMRKLFSNSTPRPHVQ